MSNFYRELFIQLQIDIIRRINNEQSKGAHNGPM
jgi:hypothetical protein